MNAVLRIALLLASGSLAGCFGAASVSPYAGALTAEPVSIEAVDRAFEQETPDEYASAPVAGEDYDAIYAASFDEGHEVRSFDWRSADPRYLRQNVDWYGSEAPGTIVIDIDNRFLYLVEPGRRAVRYGIAVGKEGFGWTGTTKLARKATWPRWFPPAAMIERKPELEEFRNGMDGGPQNPIGARALYLHQGGKDTLYRIHGTDKPWSIGRAASSGCFRMINQDVIDLYSRVGTGGQVIVRHSAADLASL